MPFFKVTLVRDATQTASVEVRANSQEEADERVLGMAHDGALHWELSDDTGKPYLMEE